MTDQVLPLGDVIRELRAEIVAAASAGEDERVRFELGPIEVEFQIVARREGGPEGKIKFEILGFGAELGGSGSFAREQTQKVKLTLSPLAVKAGGARGRVEIKRDLRRSSSG